MKENQFPVFCSEVSRERGINEGQEIVNGEQEVTGNNKKERKGKESRMKGEKRLNERQEKWRDEGDGSLADDEDDDDDDDGDKHRKSSVFTPLMKIARQSSEKQTECDDVRADDVRADDVRADDVRADDVRADDVRADDVRADDVRADDVSTPQGNTKQRHREHRGSCHVYCGETTSSVLFFLAGVGMFPLLVWAGHDLLPLDVPAVRSAPYRLVYTLRCALFASFPIVLGVFVHGVSRLKFSSLNPLFEGKRVNRHTVVHMTFVHDSLRLFLLFFLQLAVMSTYVHHNALKLVPLLTIVFVFGRLIYWPSVCFGSSARVLGFSLSFMPVLTLMGLNLYFVCSSTGEGAVFDVAPPTTPPPPIARWWG